MLGFLFSKDTSKDQELSHQRRDAFDDHLNLHWQIKNAYKQRNDDSTAIDKTISLCREQIKISKDARAVWLRENKELGAHDNWLPDHLGFKQLGIILEKRGHFQEAINLAKEAQSQGWSGDWDMRIARCERKLLKAKS